MKWLVVANRSGAEIFEKKARAALVPIRKIENPLGRAKNKVMTTGKPGLSRSRYKAAAPHSLTGEKKPHEEVAIQFAKKLADLLKKEANKNHLLKIQVVAGPRMLGRIKGHFADVESNQIQWTAKNIEKVPQEKWAKLINQQG